MLKLTGAQKDAVMLESVTGGEIRGRYSIIGMKPDLVWRCHGETSALNRSARCDGGAFTDQPGNQMDNLRSRRNCLRRDKSLVVQDHHTRALLDKQRSSSPGKRRWAPPPHPAQRSPLPVGLALG